MEQDKHFMVNIFNTIQDGICVIDKEMNLILFNSTMMNRYTNKVLSQGKKCYELFYEINQPCNNCPAITAMQQRECKIDTVRFIGQYGPIGWLERCFLPLFDQNGDVIGAIKQVRDITQRKIDDEKINSMAYHDALTGLPNRYMLNEYLNRIILRAKDIQHTVAIAFIDLDRFKYVNDTFGHSVGDILLQQAAERINKCIRVEDILSRYGGDEFVIIMEGLNQLEVSQVSQKIIDQFTCSFLIKGHKIYTSPSIGICFYPIDGNTPEKLIKNADSAMYLAKEKGKNNYQFFDANLNEKLSRKIKLGNEIRRALKYKEFMLHYQPKFDLITGKITNVEALIRWEHPQLGYICPNEFIPVAEELGLIIPIGEWVLYTACEQNKKWQRLGLSSLTISVNLSGRQLKHPSFVQKIIEILRQTELEPNYLELEINENTLKDIYITTTVLNELRNLGIKVAIDNYGTGNSLFKYIEASVVNSINIDRALVKNIGCNTKTEFIIKSIIHLGRSMHLKIVAEGVEELKQLNFLKEHQCDEIQGFYFSNPMSASDFEEKIINIP